MRPLTRAAARIAALALAAVVATGLAACSAGAPSPAASSSASSSTLPTGTPGAAHLDDGYLQAGTGSKVVDLYFDAMCPICGTFEQANGKNLAEQVNAGNVTLRLHPMTFLDRGSQGTAYSTRAAAALTCVATLDERAVLAYLATLYANQPQENTPGLTDTKLVSLATGIGATGVAACVTAGTYRGWVQAVNDRALAGPVKGTPNNRIEGTPTVLVNGTMYPGAVNDAKAFSGFLAAR
jgi:Protein-disulfide isomerase